MNVQIYTSKKNQERVSGIAIEENHAALHDKPNLPSFLTLAEHVLQSWFATLNFGLFLDSIRHKPLEFHPIAP